VEYFVYILYADSFDKFYGGQTYNADDRVLRHSKGHEKSTAPFVPWSIVWFTAKPSRAQAMSLERKLKNLSKIRIKQFIEKSI
jgi:putative endonuclease